jgi:hypothetical protein
VTSDPVPYLTLPDDFSDCACLNCIDGDEIVIDAGDIAAVLAAVRPQATLHFHP